MILKRLPNKRLIWTESYNEKRARSFATPSKAYRHKKIKKQAEKKKHKAKNVYSEYRV